MIGSIGKTAGIIWNYLDKNASEAMTINKLATVTGESKNDIQRAIGWLAREEKITIKQKGRTELIALK